jgi:hypothetical protein
MKEPKKINWAEKVFQANGKNYFISPSISIGRAVYLEEAKIELETGVRVGQTTEGFLKIWNLLQAGKFADAAVETYNRMKAVENFTERPNPVLRICACFLNREDEDITTINEEMVRSKIVDWKAEGVAMESFFTLALIFLTEETSDLKNFTKEYSNVLQNTLKNLALKHSTTISE